VGPSLAPDYSKTPAVVEVGQVISGKYKLVRLLGDGGMGSVYEAEHLGLGTHVAIKVLHGELTRKQGIAERFLQEARVSAQIRSAHVVQVTDVDRTPDGVAYLVMELLQGESLSTVISREKKLPFPTAAEYTLQILQALEAAHALGVVHRDLKPDNVFLTFQGGKPVIKLIDFGIAKLRQSGGTTKNLTVAGMLMGTPEYMAPEQAYAADKVDVRADLYAVGVMLYEMLSGQTPVSGDDPRVLVLKVERGEVTPLVHAAPGVRPEVAGFVHRSMAPRPEVRFASATEMRLALEAVLSGKRVGTTPLAAGGPGANPAFVETAQAGNEPGTGTVMGPPVGAALTPAAPGAGNGSGRPPPGGTISSPPIQHAPAVAVASPPPYMPTPTFEPTRPPSRGGRAGGSGLVIGLAVTALFLGAAAVVTYVMSTQETTPAPPPPFPTVATTTPPPPTTPTAVVTAPTTTAAPLATGPTQPATATKPDPTPPKPKADAGTQAQADAGGQQHPADAGSGQITIVTPFGNFQWPGPRPLLWPPDQPWPPPSIVPPVPPPP
jgi:eukaryotic-like serine/threonine-protein kinase